MKVNGTNLDVGTKVAICNIKGEDSFLNGMTGTLTHPFASGCTNRGWVGIRLNDTSSPYGETVNVTVKEIVILKD